MKTSPAISRTHVTLHGDSFHINGEATMQGCSLDGVSLEGLLPNARLAQLSGLQAEAKAPNAS